MIHFFLHNSNCFDFRCEGHKLNLQLFSKPSVSVTCIQIIHLSFRCYLLEMDECVFCHQSVADGQTTTTLTEKGCTGIRKASDLRNSPIAVSPGQVVHTKCRQTYVNPRVIDSHNRKRAAASSQPENPAVVLRSSESPFGYDTNCLFCGNKDIYDGKSLKHKLIPIRTLDFQRKILEACDIYQNDWTDTVRTRIMHVSDLPAADAVYHLQRSTNFRTGRRIPSMFTATDSPTTPKVSRMSGRPKNDFRADAFLRVAEYLEMNDDEQITVGNLIDKMAEYIGNNECDPYSFKHMKAELKKHFGDRIIITEINGIHNVVTFYSTAERILQEFHKTEIDSPEDEAQYIIETACKLIRKDIRDIEQNRETYPSYGEMSSADNALDYLPQSLHTFLNGLCVGKDTEATIASIGHAIIQAARPRVLLAPLQIGLAVQLHHHFQSKFLIETLHKHGFCSSYKEVIKFERSAAMAQGTYGPELNPQSFIQYAADNIDHNLCTIDGENTFHGMGIIAMVTPEARLAPTRLIKRISVTSDDIAAVGHISIQSFTSAEDILQSMTYEALSAPHAQNLRYNADLIWKASLLMKTPRPLWSGYMQMVNKGEHPGKSSVLFLPMIDLNPNDPSCIYSTLQFVASHATNYGCTPVITFDQPLWWKANAIVESQPPTSAIKSIVVRLGGFHTEMSYLGCIGHLMAGSGLRQVLEEVYASNTVGHMLSGKAISRAVRGHLLIDAALNTMLSAEVFRCKPKQICVEEEDDTSHDLHTTADVTDLFEDYDQMVNTNDFQALYKATDDILSETPMTSVENDQAIQAFSENLQYIKEQHHTSLTAKLWMQYMDMVDLLRTFIRGERLGDWSLHLYSLYGMLPYFAAAGHNLYLKSVYIYLTKMMKLKETHPEVYEHFVRGLHVVRRSDRLWAGLSPDLIIEQCLMRSLKTTGGLTRGRGMTELQRLVWVLSRPASAEINNAMQELTGITYSTSDQHKDTTSARMMKDSSDTKKLLQYLLQHNPFDPETSLRNIATGISAEPAVNAHEGKTVGDRILQSMKGKLVGEYSFKKKHQVINMETKTTVRNTGEDLQVDPQLLFQRLVTAGLRCDELIEVFTYELCAFPPALFESKSGMLVAQKASLRAALCAQMKTSSSLPPDPLQYVLDGGALLHRIPWNRGTTWNQIFNQYAHYVTSRYGQAIVVFDGYSDIPSPKDSTHIRRNSNHKGALVHFTGEMALQMRKEDFLSNKENKQRFITMLSERLGAHGCDIRHAAADADLLIVQTAIAVSATHNTILIGDDTDLLVLLCHHAKDTTNRIFFKSEPRKLSLKSSVFLDITASRPMLGDAVCEHILFAHALLGCDTTSRVFGIGKPVGLAKLRKDIFLQQADTFSIGHSSKEDIINAGENSLVCIYGGHFAETLDGLRLRRFVEKTSSSTAPVQPKTLPPTSAAAKHHSLRVYFQVQQWKGNKSLNPEEWGWKVHEGTMVPISTDRAPAPPELLEAIRCKCRTGCSTMRCSCRKNGMDCSMACSECRGACANVSLELETWAESGSEDSDTN